MLPAVLDQTILATALPTIATDLGRLSDVSWVVTAYVVAAAGVRAVFLVAAPLAALALLVVLRLPEVPLRRA
jgi:MFS family permease